MNSLEPNERPQEELPPFVRRLLFTDHLLRVGMGVIAITLPFVLVGGGWYNHIEIQHSLSHYYFASPTIFPMRTWFVGGLFALGCFLILYRGFSKVEDGLLSVLGICALLVAIVPMLPEDCKVEVCGGPALVWWPKAHGTFAVLVFLAMGSIVWFCSRKTVGELHDNRRKWYLRIYNSIAIAMVAGPVIVLLVEYFWPWGEFKWRVLGMEVIGVILFGIYWLVKTKEIRETRADKKAAMGQLERPPEHPLDPWLDPLRTHVATKFPRVARFLPTD